VRASAFLLHKPHPRPHIEASAAPSVTAAWAIVADIVTRTIVAAAAATPAGTGNDVRAIASAGVVAIVAAAVADDVCAVAVVEFNELPTLPHGRGCCCGIRHRPPPFLQEGGHFALPLIRKFHVSSKVVKGLVKEASRFFSQGKNKLVWPYAPYASPIQAFPRCYFALSFIAGMYRDHKVVAVEEQEGG
jgi:hypothetical protein